MKEGDLILVRNESTWDRNFIKGWDTCPEDHDLHRMTWVESGELGLVISCRLISCRVLFGKIPLWLEKRHLIKV